MDFWAGLWSALWYSMVFAFYVLAWIGFAILVFAVVLGMIQGIRSWFPRKLARQGRHVRKNRL